MPSSPDTEYPDTERWKIAITHTRFQYSGGSEKYIYSLVERLLAAEHDVHVFCHRHEPYDHPNLTFHRVPWRRFPKALRIRSFDASIRRAVDPTQFDVVHGFTKTQTQDIFTDGSGTGLEYIEANWSHLPAWRRAVIRNSLHQRALLDMESKRFQRGATRRVLTMSRFVRDQILARYPIEPERVEVLYNGVETGVFSPSLADELDPPFRQEHGIPAAAEVLLFVGNDWRRKGLDTALEALKTLQSSGQLDGRVLAVAGHDSRPEKYRAMAQSLGIADHVVWLGPVREIRRAFAVADVFVFPTRYDVFGNVGLEAFASGVPAALSSKSGVAELLEPENAYGHASDDDGAGVQLSDPTDAVELAQSIETLLKRDLHGKRCVSARSLAEHYSWDDHFERVIEIYREVIEEKRREGHGGPA